jgi:hypothetical protein
MPNKIQPRECLPVSRQVQWAVELVAFCIFVVNENGNRYIPYLNKQDGRFVLNWNWIDNNFNRNGRIAVSSN